MAGQDGIQRRLIELFRDKLELDVPSAETDLLETGVMDSLTFVELLFHLEIEFGKRSKMVCVKLLEAARAHGRDSNCVGSAQAPAINRVSLYQAAHLPSALLSKRLLRTYRWISLEKKRPCYPQTKTWSFIVNMAGTDRIGCCPMHCSITR